MNPSLLRDMHLDPDYISRDLAISAGLARAYRIQEEIDPAHTRLSISATYFRRAGANALLLGDYTESQNYFLEAARAYRELGLPYSVVMAALSNENLVERERYANEFLSRGQERVALTGSYHQYVYALIAQTSFPLRQTRSTRSERVIRDGLEPYRVRPLGILGITTGSILDLYDSLNPQPGFRRVDFEEAVSPFLNAYNMAFRHSTQNRYHWERLAIPFHPAEPDIYSILILTDSSLRLRHDRSVLQFIERSPISAEARVFLQTILSDITGTQRNTYQNQ